MENPIQMNKKQFRVTGWHSVTRAYLGAAPGAAVFYELAEGRLDPSTSTDERGRRVTEAFGALPLARIGDASGASLGGEDGGIWPRDVLAQRPADVTAQQAAVQDLVEFCRCFGPIGVGWRGLSERPTPFAAAASPALVRYGSHDLIAELVTAQGQLMDALAMIEARVRHGGSAEDHHLLVESMDRHLEGVRLRMLEPSGREGPFEVAFDVTSLMQVIYLQVLDHVRSSSANGIGNCGYCGGPVLRSRSAQSPNANAWHRGCANAGRLAKFRKRKGGKRKE